MVYQSDKNGCGKACVREVLSQVYHCSNYETVTLDGDCSNFLGIKTALDSFQVKVDAYDVKDFNEVKGKSLPAIAQLKVNDKYHFVVIEKISRKNIEIADPEFGYLTITKDEFLNEFTGKILLFVEADKHKKKIKSNSILSFKERFVYVLFFFVESLSLFLGLTPESEGDNFIRGVIYFGIFVIAILLLNIYNYNLTLKLEDKYLVKTLENNNTTNLKSISNLITSTIKKASNLVSLTTLALVIIYLLFLNNYYLTLLCLLPIFFVMFESSFEKVYRAKIRKCSILEDSIYLKDVKERGEIYLSSRKEAKRLLILKTLIFSSELFILAIAIFFTMYLQDDVQINVFVFYFSIVFVFYTTIKNITQILFYNKDFQIAYNSLTLKL